MRDESTFFICRQACESSGYLTQTNRLWHRLIRGPGNVVFSPSQLLSAPALAFRVSSFAFLVCDGTSYNFIVAQTFFKTKEKSNSHATDKSSQRGAKRPRLRQSVASGPCHPTMWLLCFIRYPFPFSDGRGSVSIGSRWCVGGGRSAQGLKRRPSIAERALFYCR